MIKKIQLFALTILLSTTGIQAQVGINTDGSSPDTSAILDVKSAEKGMLIPRMDDVAMGNIATPVTGLMVFNTTQNDFYYYDGTNWVPIGNAVVDNDWTVNGNDMYSAVSGNVGIGNNTPEYKLDVQGNVRHGDSLYVYSQASGNKTLWASFNSPNTYSTNVFIGAGGTTVLGSGESATYTRNGIDTTDGHETLYLTSDNKISIINQMQNGWDDRVEALVIDNSRNWFAGFKNVYLHDSINDNHRVRFITRTDYHYGYGIAINGGQGMCIGGGESATRLSDNINLEDNEILYLTSDNKDDHEAIKFITGIQNDWADKVEALTILGNGKATFDNVLRLKPSAEPTSPEEGDIYMDSTTHKLRAYDGTNWHDLW